MEKELILDYIESYDDYGELRGQEVSNDEENIYFGVCNLCECPEDAIIGRDLFTADNYVEALNKGIELAKEGYSKVILGEAQKDDE
jgi:hypothetical protein